MKFKICIVTVFFLKSVVSQMYIHPRDLKEARHLEAIQQPHLPHDRNVVAATQQFLDQFARLKALADNTPDDPPQRRASSVQNNYPAIYTPKASNYAPYERDYYDDDEDDWNDHGIYGPPAARRQRQYTNQQRYVLVPIRNNQGIVVNPNRYPGPLADALPANVG